MTDSSRKAALVTGGSRGIGRSICAELAQAGYYVVVNYLQRADAAESTLAQVRAAGSDGELLQLDVREREACKRAVSELASRKDEIGPLEVLVNNAGLAADGLFPMMSGQKWDSVIDTSLDGFFNVTRPALKAMIRNRAGCIVNLSSVSGLVGNRGQVNYSAAKAGLIGATRSLAAEVARLGIRVNAVAPGLIETDMTREMPREMLKQLVPMNRIGRPEEVAKVVRFLCSEDASYITGQVIGVNGGMI
ncbi:MAG: 3-oxoacyl-ACP reductase FabG [Deltaproteobacteria bacterium]|nr:3-oxoacyl-ACP reductase FabG [Deltaproteobacteria bacterium]